MHTQKIARRRSSTGAPTRADRDALVEETWFSAEARSARAVRTSVRRCVGAMTGLRATEEIELLAGELFAEVAHAARGSGRVCVRLRETAGRVRVEIAHEPVPDAPALAAHDPLEVAILERLLDAFAARWGRTVSSAHNATWFEYVLTVRLPDTGDPACYQGPSEESAK